jgi:hypothetical protein
MHRTEGSPAPAVASDKCVKGLPIVESQTVLVNPGLHEAEPDGDATALSREDLLALLREDPDVIVTQVPTADPERRGRGLANEILLILGTPRAIAAAVRIFKLWLQRDRDRYIRISKRAVEETREVVIDAKDLPGRSIETALKRIIDHD